ncbi:trigger factor [Cloacibacillus porcorum]|uniref:trigger factor n=1 Tax=Cloacibacillus porcorum TaxID=1197717 RepID=UPI0023EF7B6C|nr:trigger factor [Cloacibacillus porcorum]MCD8233157.1 trigger factor [Cloacibacillus porcorum]MDD7648264.1 trigger factor [Cloacibacillus porcorum]MDY4092405.1 trigger factor [Cloacibacillus porcorum]
MKTEILSQEKNVVEAKAQFTAEEVTKAVESTYKKISKQANIKGFRKGKIPRRTLELYFPKDAVYAETMENLVPDAIDKMIEEYELKLIAEPDVKPGEIKEGEGFEVTVKFEVTPQFDLPNLEEIEVEKTVYETTDEMVEDQVKRIVESRAEMVPTYEERPLTKDDYASVQYDTFLYYEDGSEKKAEEGQKTEIFLGADTMRPEVVEALVGKAPGETVSIELPVEGEEAKKDHVVKSRYEIEVLGIMKKTTPELTDELVIEITQSKHKTTGEFKEEVRKQLEAAAENQSKENLKDTIVNKIAGMVEVDVPMTLIERQKDSIRKQQAERIKRENNMTMEEFFEKSGMNKESYEAELDMAAMNIVKRALVLEAVAEANDIEWTPEELTQEITSIARMSGVDPKKLQDYIYGDRDRLFEMAEKIRNRKTVDYLVTTVKVTEVPEKKAEEKVEKEAE